MSLRIGVIGAGGMGREHIDNLHAHPDSDVVVVADALADAARAAAGPVGAEATTDSMATAGRTDLDGLVIASPDDTHADLAVAAVAAGTPVLCEKPLATTAADAERVVAAEAAAGRSLVQVGFMRPYDPAHRQLAAVVRDLGQIRHIRCAHRNTNDAWERPLEVVLSQSVIHDVHTIRWLSGAEVVRVVTHVVRSPDRIEHVMVTGVLTSGASVSMEFVEATYGYDCVVEVTAAGGWAAAPQPPVATIRRGGDEVRRIGDDWFGRFRDAYRIEIDDWIDGLGAGTVRGATAADGLAAQRVIDAAIRSATTGAVETV